MWAFLSFQRAGVTLFVVCVLLVAVASLVDHGLEDALASGAAAVGLSSCSSWALQHWLHSCGAWA